MRHRATAFALLIALSGCGGGNGNVSAGASDLAGLYEGRAGTRRNQLCLVERDGATRFGLIAWARQGDNSCTGRGRATRAGGRLSLAMQGDDSCIVEARIEGRSITLPATLPQGCAYYCGPGAEMAGTRFDRSVDGDDAARRAADLVGDPLCG